MIIKRNSNYIYKVYRPTYITSTVLNYEMELLLPKKTRCDKMDMFPKMIYVSCPYQFQHGGHLDIKALIFPHNIFICLRLPYEGQKAYPN